MRLVTIDEWVNTLPKNSEDGVFFGASHFYSDAARRPWETDTRGWLARLGESRCAGHPPLSPKVILLAKSFSQWQAN
jgi:hypothetical protein